MSDTQAPKQDKAGKKYKDTLNLPKTAFPMKANLVQNEPASVKRWEQMGLYARLRERGTGKPKFVFHDGPPYANGSIHLGHVLNKTLKDLVVRSRTMMGFDVPFVPGWDCHGLPIEHKVMTGLVESGKFKKLADLPDDVRKTAVRRECMSYAEKYVKLQAGEMTRLLTLADYEHPYLTTHHSFEGAVLETFAGAESFLARVGPALADGRDLVLICRSGNRTRAAAEALAGRIPHRIVPIEGGMRGVPASGYAPVAPG